MFLFSSFWISNFFHNYKEIAEIQIMSIVIGTVLVFVIYFRQNGKKSFSIGQMWELKGKRGGDWGKEGGGGRIESFSLGERGGGDGDHSS